ncbi:MAG: M20/M25/M40 family metallo-hydrolase [Lachnospiraceae bacterium]|nr:M20/M25/M40 family metallo-hydrolase [Lachnospiraceae bacterium]
MYRAVEKNREDFIDFMKRLISHRSYSGEEGEIAACILEEFKKTEVDEAFVDGIGNVVGIIRGTGEGPNILMISHMDAVPEDSLENWAPFDPYRPEIKDGMLYGRGISDMKGGLASQLYGMKVLAEGIRKAGVRLPGDLAMVCTVQEEPAGFAGANYFFDNTMAEHDIKADFVFLAEPSHNELMLGQRGKVEIAVKTLGKTAHASKPSEGVNALELMVPIMQDIFTHTGIDLKTDPLLGECTVTILKCTAGGDYSSIPDECEILVDRRYTTEQTMEELLDEFRVIFKRLKTAYPDFRGEVYMREFEEISYTGVKSMSRKYNPPWITDRDHPIVQKAFTALEKVGQEPKGAYWLFGTEGCVSCAMHGIPTLGYSGAVESQAHQPKEHVSLDEMMKTLEGYVSIFAEVYDVDRTVFE